MPTENFRRRYELRHRVTAAVDSEVPSTVLDRPVELHRAPGKNTLIHGYKGHCGSTGRKVRTEPYHATIHELLADPKLCDCATMVSKLGAAGAYLDALRELGRVTDICDRLEREPAPHRWTLWWRANTTLERAGENTTRWDYDDLDGEIADLRHRLGHLESTVVEEWRTNRHSVEGHLWWRAEYRRRRRRGPNRVFYEKVCLGHTPAEILAGDLAPGVDVEGLWDELHAPDDHAADTATVVMTHLRPLPINRVATLQWGIAATTGGYEAVLECPRWLPALLDADRAAILDGPVDADGARLILELAGPAYSPEALDAAIAAATLAAA